MACQNIPDTEALERWLIFLIYCFVCFTLFPTSDKGHLQDTCTSGLSYMGHKTIIDAHIA